MINMDSFHAALTAQFIKDLMKGNHIRNTEPKKFSFFSIICNLRESISGFINTYGDTHFNSMSATGMSGTIEVGASILIEVLN